MEKSRTPISAAGAAPQLRYGQWFNWQWPWQQAHQAAQPTHSSSRQGPGRSAALRRPAAAAIAAWPDVPLLIQVQIGKGQLHIVLQAANTAGKR